MDQQIPTAGDGPGLKSNVAVGNPAVGDPAVGDPAINLPKTRPVTLNLLTQPSDAVCTFWVGLAAAGPQPPPSLLDVPDVAALLTSAATTGINERGPLMLADTSAAPPRYVFLMPLPGSDFRDRVQWIHDLVASLAAWAPTGVGLYVAPEILPTEAGLELLLDVLRVGIPRLAATTTYHLLTGAHGINAVLNAALRLKGEMDGDELSLYVYH